MLRSRPFLLWVLPVLLFAGICYPLVDVFDGPEQETARGDFTADEHPHSLASHSCLMAETARKSQGRVSARALERAKNAAESAVVLLNSIQLNVRGGSPGEAVVLMDRRWQFLRRSALNPRAPNPVA